MNARIRGFTLVELAIVMVIIGLLMGGILKGQELINNAKAKSEANDFKVVAAAYYGYVDRFHAVPGDDASATSHVGSGTTNGNGNGVIAGNWNAGSVTSCTDESCLFWQHVRLAGLLSGTTVTTSGSFLPMNADSGRLGISGTTPIKTLMGSFFVCSGNLTARMALQIDSILDDGVPTTGSVRAVDAGSAAFPADASGITDPSTDTKYYIVCAGY